MRAHFTLAGSLLILLSLVSAAVATVPFNISYQARLTDSQGDPVPDDIYQAEFKFYADSTGGSPALTKTLNIATKAGCFNTLIGMEALDLPAFEGQLFLETTIGGEVMIPRTRLTVVPYSAISQRVRGDIQTDVGLLRLIDPVDDGIGVELNAKDDIHSLVVIDPVDDLPAAELKVDSEQSSLLLIDPVDDGIGFEMTVNNTIHSLLLIDPVDDGKPLVQMSGGIDGGASYVMFNPQPEPPARLFEINSSPASGASMVMFNPQPEPPADDPVLEMYATADGGSIAISNPDGKCWGFEPTPFSPGGFMYFIDPTADDTNITLRSNGALKALNGAFGYDIDNTGDNNLSVGAYNNLTGSYSFGGGYLAQVYHNNCFVWADYTPDVGLATTANNQFLVRASGGTVFYSNGSGTAGVALSPDGSSWNAIVPPLTADNSSEIDKDMILAKIERLPMKLQHSDFSGKSTGHIIASTNEFNTLFETGNEAGQISALDQSGVALVGVQQLIQDNKKLTEMVVKLEQRIAELENKMH